MKKLIFIILPSLAALFLCCNIQSTKVEQAINSLPVAASKAEAEGRPQIITDTLSSDIENINLIISCDTTQQNDYIAEHQSGVPDTSKYARDRDVDKGLIYFPCSGKRLHDYKIAKGKIAAIVSIKYDMTVYDKTDYVFTRDSIFEIHTSTANAGIFTDSEIKQIPNNTDISGKSIFTRNNKKCDFNDFLFNLVLKFCRENNVKTK